MLKSVHLWHPFFVHFSVALLSAATGFYVLATVFKENRLQPRWLTVAHWNLGVGLGMTILTLLFGLLAFNAVGAMGHNVAAHEAMVRHRDIALVTAAGFCLLGLVAVWRRARPHYPSWWFTGLLVLCCGLLMVTGLRGGELVYHHGLGVQPRPESTESTDDTHHHEHEQVKHN